MHAAHCLSPATSVGSCLAGSAAPRCARPARAPGASPRRAARAASVRRDPARGQPGPPGVVKRAKTPPRRAGRPLRRSPRRAGRAYRRARARSDAGARGGTQDVDVERLELAAARCARRQLCLVQLAEGRVPVQHACPRLLRGGRLGRLLPRLHLVDPDDRRQLRLAGATPRPLRLEPPHALERHAVPPQLARALRIAHVVRARPRGRVRGRDLLRRCAGVRYATACSGSCEARRQVAADQRHLQRGSGGGGGRGGGACGGSTPLEQLDARRKADDAAAEDEDVPRRPRRGGRGTALHSCWMIDE